MQEVLDRRMSRHGRWEYKVQWKGYSIDEAQWLPEDNLDRCQDLVDEFNARYVGANELIKRQKRSTGSTPDPVSSKQVKRDDLRRNYPLRRKAMPVGEPSGPTDAPQPQTQSETTGVAERDD